MKQLLALAVAVCALTPSFAHAAPETPSSADAEPTVHRVWYGWQTLAVDGASLALPVAGAMAGAENSNMVDAAAAGYLFGAPIVHFAHGNVGRGFGSFGVRVGSPLGGAVVGALATSRGNCDYCGFGGVVLGGLAGIGGAIALDASVLAYDREVRSVALGVVPGNTAEQRPPTLVVAGSF